MDLKEMRRERNEQCEERHALAVDRLRGSVSEETVSEKYRAFFQDTALFLLELENVRRKVSDGSWERYSLEEMQSLNEILYRDILPDHYQESYGNPAYASAHLGEVFGPLLSFLYSELRSQIPNVFEGRLRPIAAACETFIEIYNLFEESIPQEKEVRDVLYWYVSDYADQTVRSWLWERFDPSYSFARDIIMESDLKDLRYLYGFGEYISPSELSVAEFLNSLPEETVRSMADCGC